MGAESICFHPPHDAPRASSRTARRLADQLGDIGGLVFDLDDVLYDATLWRRWLVKLLMRLGMQVSYRSFFRTWDREYLDAVYRGHRERGEAFQAFLLASGLSRGQIDEVEAASIALRRELAADARPLPGVRSTLARLKQSGIALGVLSDAEGRAAELSEQLVHLGLGNLFGTVISSFDLERTKPDPACYEAALAGLRLPAERVAFVGHDAEELAGARAVRMRTIAFNNDPEAVADIYLGNFHELLELLPEAPPLPTGSALN
jgi:HAD superfamily hydrolase (TIGR01509 family)